MPNETASPVFVGAHVPLFFLLLWLSHHQREVVRDRTRLGVSGFLVLHALLHFANSSAPSYEFHGLLSHTMIVGAALAGAGYLFAAWREGSAAAPS